MNPEKLINFCRENGILLDKDSLDFFISFDNLEIVFSVILKFREDFDNNFITKKLILENIMYFKKSFFNFGLKDEDGVSSFEDFLDYKNNSVIVQDYEILSKKIKIEDFSNYFRFRFDFMKDYLIKNNKMGDLVSINKISRNNDPVSIVGLVYSKKITKNNNVLIEVEDFTGKVKVLLNSDRLKDVSDEISLDSVIGIKGIGSKDIIFADEVFFCDSYLDERKVSNVDESVAFIGDMHTGSDYFLEKEFLGFIDFLNSGNEDAKKIKYLFVVGDLICGVGVYPGQEKELKINSIKEQYVKVYELLSKIREDINIIIFPGNHEEVRLVEPQPKVSKKYAKDIYSMKNVFICNNPSDIIIGKNKDFEGLRVLAYHGFSFIYYINNISRFILEKIVNTPEKLMQYFLKNRHLAPAYSSSKCFPSDSDELIIKDIPDIFVAGHLHRSGFGYYNNILNISCSCWESLTSNQKKLGVVPDFCKVPVFNLKSRELKILDFEKRKTNDGN
jgi:DNA polymerase II small subunit